MALHKASDVAAAFCGRLSIEEIARHFRAAEKAVGDDGELRFTDAGMMRVLKEFAEDSNVKRAHEIYSLDRMFATFKT